MPRKPVATYRCDLLSHGMNARKEQQVVALVQAWRQVASRIGAQHWRHFFEQGSLNARLYPQLSGVALGNTHQHMVSTQVAGILASWVSNRANDFQALVQRSTLASDLKHQLHTINRRQAWFSRAPLTLKDGTPIEPAVRRLARTLFHRVGKPHRRPNLSHINLVIDPRMVTVVPAAEMKRLGQVRGLPASDAAGRSPFGLWLKLATLTPGKPVWVPLRTHAHFLRRQGKRAGTVQINVTDHGLKFGLLTDVSDALTATKAAYQPRTVCVALDLGLRNLFTTDTGDQLGRNWMDRLEVIDRKLTKLAAYRQKHGLPVRSARYRRYVSQLRGFITSEVNRILNRLVARTAPATIVVEHLRFQSPNLSRRLNRLLSWFGKSTIESKLKSLSETFGITVDTVHAAYSSQECSTCHYVAKSNRPTQSKFRCGWCGLSLHADVNAPRVLRHRRSVSLFKTMWQPRRAILDHLVRQHVQRFDRLQAQPDDPRRTNPYFKGQFRPVISTDDFGAQANACFTVIAG